MSIHNEEAAGSERTVANSWHIEVQGLMPLPDVPLTPPSAILNAVQAAYEASAKQQVAHADERVAKAVELPEN